MGFVSNIMSKVFSYIVARDYGFAPNPFYGVLTLATCKPVIRKTASIGDFIIGCSNKALGNKLIYMAKVSEILTFDQYWNDPRFAKKKPVMNGSLKNFMVITSIIMMQMATGCRRTHTILTMMGQ